ncbi:SAM-dependent methyltransferase [Actinopolyspora lacussalsi]|nr:SAM-dependent methyltransferase [Actinopolyspora lacussalsi]
MSRARLAADDLLPYLATGGVLEVGVGTGALAQALRERGRAISGVDISEPMLRQARERLGSESVTRADAVALPFPADDFANVVLAHVAHLVDDITEALSEAARVVAPGGRVLLLHGHPIGEVDELSEATSSLRPLEQQRTDSPERVRETAERVGLLTVSQDRGTAYEHGMTPAELARNIETRQCPYLWDVDAETWTAAVEPALEALRALPEQERTRTNRWQVHRSVFAAP